MLHSPVPRSRTHETLFLPRDSFLGCCFHPSSFLSSQERTHLRRKDEVEAPERSAAVTRWKVGSVRRSRRRPGREQKDLAYLDCSASWRTRTYADCQPGWRPSALGPGWETICVYLN